MRRRGFLAAAAGAATGAALAGCIRRGPGPREAADPWRTRENVSEDDVRLARGPIGGDREVQQGIQGEVVLRRGEYAAYPYGAPPEAGAMFAILRADSRLALPFDVFTFRREDFPAYRDGEDSGFLSAATTLGGTRAGFDNRLNPGEYVLVFDNTRLGQARPLDEVTIRFVFAVVYSE